LGTIIEKFMKKPPIPVLSGSIPKLLNSLIPQGIHD